MANHILPATLATAITITSVPAVAQSPQASEDPPRATSDEPVVLAVEEVKVTALKRRDALNTLPVSVSVVDGDAFVTSSIDTGAALTRETPNFAFAGFGQPGNDFVNIRGVGILGQPANSLDNTVGFATNGAATSALGYPGLLLDVERIEILRGPQGTLFGRNALGGLVNIVTRPADGRRDVGITLEGGADGYQLAEAVAGGWLSENRLAGRLAVRHHQQDGDIKNPVINADEGGLKAAAARGTLSYQIAPHIHADLVLSHDRNEQESSFLLLQEHPEFPISGADQMPYNDRRRSEGTLEVQAEYDAFSLTSLSNV